MFLQEVYDAKKAATLKYPIFLCADNNNQPARLYINKKPLKRPELAFVGWPLIRTP
jgi:hypothetical protein